VGNHVRHTKTPLADRHVAAATSKLVRTLDKDGTRSIDLVILGLLR